MTAARTLLTADADFYVATTGSDSNDGTQTSPWATLQHAANWIQANVDMGASVATVHVAAGTYAPVRVRNPFLGGDPQRMYPVLFSGDTTTPSNVVIVSGNGVQSFNLSDNAVVGVEGFKLTGDVGGLYASAGAVTFINGRMEYGSISGPHYHIQANVGGKIIDASSAHTISGGASCWIYASAGIIEFSGSPTVTLVGMPNFSSAFAYSDDNGVIRANGMTFSGPATGDPFHTVTGGGIRTGCPSNPNYFPGNGAFINLGWYA